MPEILPFEKIYEQYYSAESNYLIGDLKLSEWIAHREELRDKDLFLANIPQFFLNRD